MSSGRCLGVEEQWNRNDSFEFLVLSFELSCRLWRAVFSGQRTELEYISICVYTYIVL